MSFGKYQFLPWERRGIAAYIKEADLLGVANGTVLERATVPITVNVNADVHEQKAFKLIGPGDIVGVNADMIVRTEPLDGISNFEPNYLAYIEFYDEDFCWRYTPASASGIDNLNLRPWMALVVLREDEFTDPQRHKPLPSITVLNLAALPPANELHLWAHVHFNQAFEKTLQERFLDELQENAKTDPDGRFSRLMCPRHLQSNAMYHAFVVPAYETGRLAGLGRSITGIPAQQPAWGSGSDAEMPYYYRWHFRTGENFDFEYLVKLLEPRVMDKRVGVRPMDCSAPGFVQMDQALPVVAPNPAILWLEGALKSPQAPERSFPGAAPEQEFLKQLEKLVNLNLTQQANLNEDPYITVPFYGMFHAMQKDASTPPKPVLPVFDAGSDVWYDDLNRDPRSRVPAGFGTRVVQENQEKFMDSAWKQLKSVLEANRKMQAAQFTAKVTQQIFDKHVAPLTDAKLLALSRNMSARVLVNSVTVKHAVAESQVPATVFTHAFRRNTRNQTALSRGLARSEQIYNIAAAPPFGDDITPQRPAGFQLENVVSGLNAEGTNRLSAAPLAKFEAVSDTPIRAGFQSPANLADIQVWSLQSNLDADFVFNLTDFQGGLPDVGKWNFYFGANIFQPGGLDPVIGGNVLGGIGGGIFDPGMGGGIFDPGLGGGGGGVVVLRAAAPPPDGFQTAYINIQDRLAFSPPVPIPTPLAVDASASQTRSVVSPSAAYLRYVNKTILHDDLKKVGDPEDFLPAMAYPDFPEATYDYLAKIDKELLIPNLDLIPFDTISLLRTNQKFIEAYLVGLNFEMGRELLWREYPTDMRGSYFRQFWDVHGFVTPDTSAVDAEKMKDIKPIHTWGKTSKLGFHNALDPEGDSEQLVLVIRGELLKKYPNTVIYAQKAFKKDGKRIIHLSEAVGAGEILYPIYKADLSPDIKLLGFNLTVEQARGTVVTAPFSGADTKEEGWFFIIAEVPGEVRFGMDLNYEPDDRNALSWNDLSWENFDGQTLDHIRGSLVPGNTGKPNGDFTPPNNSHFGIWNRDSANMAAILFQRPVMIAVHATEMLANLA